MTSFANGLLRQRRPAWSTLLEWSVVSGCALASVAGLSACSSTPARESAKVQSQDTLVTARVKAALLRDASLSALPIDVTTKRGTVALSGTVESPTQITQALNIVRQIDGAEVVRNDLHVKTP